MLLFLGSPNTSGGFKSEEYEEEDFGSDEDGELPSSAQDTSSSLNLSDGSYLFEIEGLDYSFMTSATAPPSYHAAFRH